MKKILTIALLVVIGIGIVFYCGHLKRKEVKPQNMEKTDADDINEESETRLQRNDTSVTKLLCNPISAGCRPFDIDIEDEKLYVNYCGTSEKKNTISLRFKKRIRKGVHDSFLFDEVIKGKVCGRYKLSRDYKNRNFSNQHITYTNKNGENYEYKYSVIYKELGCDDYMSYYFTYFYRLKDLIHNDPSTMDLPPERFVDTSLIKVCESQDGILRTYSWNDGWPGTMTSWGNVIQYRIDDKVIAHLGTLSSLLGPITDGDFGSYITDVQSITDDNGNAIYLIFEYFREWSTMGYNCVRMITFNEGKWKEHDCIYTGKGVDSNREKTSLIDNEHNIPDLYSMYYPCEHWNQLLFVFDEKKEELYVGVMDDLTMTGKYDIYRFDGHNFVYDRTDGGFWLHPSVRSFNAIKQYMETENYKIRVDQMPDKTYRYVSWKHNKSESERPDLVLYGGKCSVESSTWTDSAIYTFNGDEGYIYEVHGKNALIVRKGGRIILEEKHVIR